MRFAYVLAALSLGISGAHAQIVPPADHARVLLQSQSLRDKAWGAWYAGASHDPAMLQPLLAQLQLAQPMRSAQRDTQEYAYIQAIFDALIQIPGPIPTDLILPFEDSWRPEILILLSRDATAEGAENALLDMRERSLPAPEWTAVNDLLFAISSKAFFQKTLQEIRVTHDFVIIDPNQGVAFCGGGIGCGGTRRHFPKGFPPIALYQLWTASSLPGDIVFIEQPVAIHYRRIVVPTGGEVGWRNCQSDSLVGDSRQTLLARLFGAVGGRSSDDAYQLFHPRTTLNWQNAAQAASEIENLLTSQAAAVQALIEDAQTRDLVHASGMRLAIETTINDLRSDKSVPVPAVTPREIVIP
jgi:hypothetical protein